MSCPFCNSEHKTMRVEFKLNGKKYVRPAAYCSQQGYFISMKPPIEGIGVDTIVMPAVAGEHEVRELLDGLVPQEEPKFWEQV